MSCKRELANNRNDSFGRSVWQEVGGFSRIKEITEFLHIGTGTLVTQFHFSIISSSIALKFVPIMRFFMRRMRGRSSLGGVPNKGKQIANSSGGLQTYSFVSQPPDFLRCQPRPGRNKLDLEILCDSSGLLQTLFSDPPHLAFKLEKDARLWQL